METITANRKSFQKVGYVIQLFGNDLNLVICKAIYFCMNIEKIMEFLFSSKDIYMNCIVKTRYYVKSSADHARGMNSPSDPFIENSENISMISSIKDELGLPIVAKTVITAYFCDFQ